MSKKITIISQDFDGCYSIMTPGGFHAEFYVKNKKYWEEQRIKKGLNFDVLVSDVRDQFNTYLTQITKDAAEVHVYVGSDRQSKLSDDHNAKINNNGSVFSALDTLCLSRNSPEQPWLFETLLLSDPKIEGSKPFFRDRGVAYKAIREGLTPHLDISESDVYFEGARGSSTKSKRPFEMTPAV